MTKDEVVTAALLGEPYVGMRIRINPEHYGHFKSFERDIDVRNFTAVITGFNGFNANGAPRVFINPNPSGGAMWGFGWFVPV